MNFVLKMVDLMLTLYDHQSSRQMCLDLLAFGASLQKQPDEVDVVCLDTSEPGSILKNLLSFHTQFLVFHTQFLVFDTQFLVFDTQFLVFNAKFIICTHRSAGLPPQPGNAIHVGPVIEQKLHRRGLAVENRALEQGLLDVHAVKLMKRMRDSSLTSQPPSSSRPSLVLLPARANSRSAPGFVFLAPFAFLGAGALRGAGAGSMALLGVVALLSSSASALRTCLAPTAAKAGLRLISAQTFLTPIAGLSARSWRRWSARLAVRAAASMCCAASMAVPRAAGTLYAVPSTRLRASQPPVPAAPAAALGLEIQPHVYSCRWKIDLPRVRQLARPHGAAGRR